MEMLAVWLLLLLGGAVVLTALFFRVLLRVFGAALFCLVLAVLWLL
jgi:hypothetical protein